MKEQKKKPKKEKDKKPIGPPKPRRKIMHDSPHRPVSKPCTKKKEEDSHQTEDGSKGWSSQTWSHGKTEHPKGHEKYRKKIIDANQVRMLAAINCSTEEMELVLGIRRDSLYKRFSKVIKEGRAIGRTSLKRWMYQKAESGNVVMMIWLSKNLLGYTDKVETVNTDRTFLVKDLDGTPKLKLVTESDFYDRKSKDDSKIVDVKPLKAAKENNA